MSDMECQMACEEVVSMVHESVSTRPRKKGYIVSEQDALNLATVNQQIAQLTAQRDNSKKTVAQLQVQLEDRELMETKRLLIQGVFMASICVGQILGMAEELVNPAFGAVSIAVCGIGAWLSVKWGKYHA